MKVIVLGVRGMPDVQGGVETHAEQLYSRVAGLGFDIEVVVRTPFVTRERRQLGAIKLRRIWSPQKPGLEALVHSVLGVLYAAVARPDILHIHAIGPAIVTPIARLFGLRVVVTHHGPDYERDKWGWFARAVLKLGERFGMRYSNERIAISRGIVRMILANHQRDSVLIPNGVVVPELAKSTESLDRHGLTSGKYFLQVSRMVPEKRQLDLIHAFVMASIPGWKLVLVGGLGSDDFCGSVREAASAAKVVLTGFMSGSALQEIYSHAGAFVLPSSHEGLPIVLLEALSYGLPIIASDIPANLEVGLGAEHYFPLGDIVALSAALQRAASAPMTPIEDETRTRRRGWVRSNYNWVAIAEQTADVYGRLSRKR